MDQCRIWGAYMADRASPWTLPSQLISIILCSHSLRLRRLASRHQVVCRPTSLRSTPNGGCGAYHLWPTTSKTKLTPTLMIPTIATSGDSRSNRGSGGSQGFSSGFPLFYFPSQHYVTLGSSRTVRQRTRWAWTTILVRHIPENLGFD